ARRRVLRRLPGGELKMLALIALAAAPLSIPANGWVAFEQPAVAQTTTLGCVGGRDAALAQRENSWIIHDDRDSQRFERFTVYLGFEDGELSEARAYTPDCRVRDADTAARRELSGAEGVALMARFIDGDEDLRSRLFAHIAHVADPAA